ncbi:hypothetical protein GS891_11465 [Rhodococcus hoagii]|nr:hypothetical protein [Prescottella equi]
MSSASTRSCRPPSAGAHCERLPAGGHRRTPRARHQQRRRLLRSSHCTARNYRAVVALFDELELTPGTSGKSRRPSDDSAGHSRSSGTRTLSTTRRPSPSGRDEAGHGAAAEVAANRREAAALAAEGMSAEAIAQELGVHGRTVERYLAVAS